MGVFSTMADVIPTASGQWFVPGTYICMVRRCQHFISQQGKGNGVAIEVEILLTTHRLEAGRTCWINGEILPASYEAGAVCSQVLWLDRQKPALGNLKNFLLSASALTDSQVIEVYAAEHNKDVSKPETAQEAWEGFAARATGGDGTLLAGQIIVARADRIRKKDGGPFTRVVWEPASATTHALLEAAQQASNRPATDPATDDDPGTDPATV